MSKEIKIALCGCRGHIDKFGRMINSYDESETIAVWDDDAGRAQKIADLLDCPAYTNYDALLAIPGLTGVVITAPNYLHTQMVLKAIAAGKNVFVEKPLCTNVEEAYAIQKAVKESGVKFFMTDPFVNASTTYIRDFIKSGKLGKLISVRVRFCSNGLMFRKRSEEQIKNEVAMMGGGMMSDTGGHPLHIVNYLLGKPEKIHSVFTYGSEAAKAAGSEEYIAMMMEYPEDVVAIVESGMIAQGYTNGVEVCGTHGVIMEVGSGDRKSEVKYRICQVTDEDIAGGMMAMRAAMQRGDWVTVSKDELPDDPDDHIRYFVKMQAYDLPNDIVGVDNASTHGLSIDSAVELVEMREAIYKAAETGCAAIVR